MTTGLTLSWREQVSRLRSLGDLRLPTQFAVAGGAIMLLAMALAGSFTSNVVSRAAIQNTASATALLLDSFLAPLVRELERESGLTPSNTRQLNEIVSDGPFKRRFPHLEIWKKGGLVAYSTTPSMIGKRFEPHPDLLAALEGQVTAEFTDERIRRPVGGIISTYQYQFGSISRAA